MEIKNLITFTKVAEAGSLSHAARLLGYAQSTVTMQMQQLEQELGVPLYERVGKKIRITQAGQELLTYAVPIIRMSQEAMRIGKHVPAGVEGTLRLGVLEQLADDRLAEQMDRYVVMYPEVELQVRTEYDKTVLLHQLRHNELDLVVTLDDQLTDSDLIHPVPDLPVELHFYMTGGHPLTRKASVTREEILACPLIHGSAGLSCEQQLVKWIGQDGIRQIVVQNQDLALRMAVRQGMGGTRAAVVAAPEGAASEYIADGRLKALNYEIPQCRMWRQTLCHKNKWTTGPMKAWVAMAGDGR